MMNNSSLRSDTPHSGTPCRTTDSGPVQFPVTGQNDRPQRCCRNRNREHAWLPFKPDTGESKTTAGPIFEPGISGRIEPQGLLWHTTAANEDDTAVDDVTSL